MNLIVNDTAVEAAALVLAPFVFDDRRLPFRTHGESRSTEELREAERAREFAKARAALSAALPFLGAAASVECPGMFVGWSAFGATYPDTVCSTALTWDDGAEPPSATLCDADDDHRPRGVPCPVCDPEGFDRYEEHSGAHLAVYRLCGLVPEPGAAPSATREDLTGIINDAVFEGVEYARAERVAAYLHARFTITPRTDR